MADKQSSKAQTKRTKVKRKPVASYPAPCVAADPSFIALNPVRATPEQVAAMLPLVNIEAFVKALILSAKPSDKDGNHENNT